jgi:hypothetical protein
MWSRKYVVIFCLHVTQIADDDLRAQRAQFLCAAVGAVNEGPHRQLPLQQLSRP